MKLHPPGGAAIEAKEIIQQIKTVAKQVPNSRPSKILQGMENVHNKEIIFKLPDRNAMKPMINL